MATERPRTPSLLKQMPAVENEKPRLLGEAWRDFLRCQFSTLFVITQQHMVAKQAGFFEMIYKPGQNTGEIIVSLQPKETPPKD